MDDGQLLALRLTTLGCATLVVIMAGLLALACIRQRSNWVTACGFAIAAGMILAGYRMFSEAAWMWNHL